MTVIFSLNCDGVIFVGVGMGWKGKSLLQILTLFKFLVYKLLCMILIGGNVRQLHNEYTLVADIQIQGCTLDKLNHCASNRFW